MTGTYQLIGSKWTGSMIVEAAFALSGIPCEVEQIPYGGGGPDHQRLLGFNPLGQVPTLILPDGKVMTESAAIILHLADLAPQAKLAPAADDPLRPHFLRWLVFLVAALYPTFTYGDDPKSGPVMKQAASICAPPPTSIARPCGAISSRRIRASPGCWARPSPRSISMSR